MPDPGLIYTIWSTIGTSVAGTIYWIYNRYHSILGAMTNRPTKAEVQEIMDNETDKLNIKLDSMENSIKELHGDVQLLLSCMLYAQRQTPQGGDPTGPQKPH